MGTTVWLHLNTSLTAERFIHDQFLTRGFWPVTEVKNSENTGVYEFGPFRLDAQGLILEEAGVGVEAQPKTLQLLLYLVQRPDRVVTKDELLREVWRGSVVSETALTRAVMKARKLLGEDSGWIQTLHGRGYRFVGEVRHVVGSSRAAESVEELRSARLRNLVRLLTGYGAFVWLFNQGAAVLWEAFEWPRDAQQWLLLASIAGFVPAALIGWFYLLTPQGLKQHQEIRRPNPGSWVSRMTIGLLSLALVISLTLNIVSTPPSSKTLQPSTMSDQTSIAVLPFRTLSEGNIGYVGEGLSTTLRQGLSRLPQTRVLARVSSKALRNSDAQPVEVARDFGVSHLIEGSVQQQGDTMRIAVALLDGGSGAQIWSTHLDATADELFVAQDHITTVTTQALARLVSGIDEVSAAAILQGQAQRGTDDLEAYRAYLQGTEQLSVRTRESIARAAGHFERALALDPIYAKAWAELARAKLQLATFGVGNRAEGFAGARGAACRALGFDPTLSDPHLILAQIQMRYEWDFAAAERSVQSAHALAPKDSDVATLQAGIWSKMGLAQRAAQEVERAWALDPLNASVASSLTIRLIRAERYEDAERALGQLLALKPDHGDRHWLRAQLELERGNYSKAMKAIEPDELEYLRLSINAIAQFHMGNSEDSLLSLQRLIDTDEGAAFQIAEVYAHRGEIEASIEWLQKAYSARDPGFAELLSTSGFRVLSGQAPFEALKAQLRVNNAPGSLSAAEKTACG